MGVALNGTWDLSWRVVSKGDDLLNMTSWDFEEFGRNSLKKNMHFRRDVAKILGENLPHVILFIFGTFLFGAVTRTLLKRIKLPYTVIVCMAGIAFGALSVKYPQVRQYSETLANINPLLLIHAFMPVLIFSSAFEIESHIFLKSLSQVSLD
ncbi:hypothetical protein chiPu_0009392 [Chiloscyllium punctatum]|uniref:Cation/H+ exchanger domain-containing protein n=1 Tax=Chiloscyllium punctatum TaxID=137246 RepID=A0A401SKN2_CHIPU|nr:hypothetical protein [Chiloscyllium punctatum]